MTCQRCNGLMIREQYDNLEFDSAGYEISGWRCLNCGAIVDPVIATHRQTTHSAKPEPGVPATTEETRDGDITDSSITAARKYAVRPAQHNPFTEVLHETRK